MQVKLTEKNLNYAAELLRDWIFVGKGMGCYSNFDLRNGFKEVFGYDLLGKQMIKLLRYDLYDGSDLKPQIHMYWHPSELISVAWYWDGDGTLLIGYDGKWIKNDDCKKDYTWEFVN